MMKHAEYKGQKVYNSKQVRGLLSVEFDLLLHIFQENKDKFKYGVNYFFVDREMFAAQLGEHIKGTSKMIYLWTGSGVQLLKELLDSERQLTIWDINTNKKPEVTNAKVSAVEELDIFVPADGLDVGDVARALQSKNIIDFGQNTLFRKLRNRGVLNSFNVPYQQYIQNGCFGIYIQEKKNGKGEYVKCKVFAKGIRKIIEWFSVKDGDDE